MSSPRNVGELGQGIPLAVNKGIRREDYPVRMSSSKRWIRVIGRMGRTAVMSKADMVSAYKVIWEVRSASFSQI